MGKQWDGRKRPGLFIYGCDKDDEGGGLEDVAIAGDKRQEDGH